MTADELLGLLRDTAQGASNSAASTVSAPVDVLAWLLRKGGLPVGPAPVLGSDWMAQKGLTAQPKNALAGMAGETIGNILPIAASAKAPQIANALMRADEALTNQLGPTIANAAEQYMVKTGMIQPATVWHGSPHKFDAFDASKIGTGEGAQAYGHGLYLADSPTVAKEYAEKLSNAGLARHTLTQSAGDIDAAIAAAQTSVQNYKALIANGGGGDTRRAQGMLALAEKKLADLTNMKAGTLDEAGNLYKVDLPDNAIARMLDWDKPLSQQAPEAREAIENLLRGSASVTEAAPGLWQVTDPSLVSPVTFSDKARAANYASQMNSKAGAVPEGAADAYLTAQNRVGRLAAAEAMRKAGIPGIRYLDGGSRGAGAGTSNYVVFPGNENLLRILERNGVPIGN